MGSQENNIISIINQMRETPSEAVKEIKKAIELSESKDKDNLNSFLKTLSTSKAKPALKKSTTLAEAAAERIRDIKIGLVEENEKQKFKRIDSHVIGYDVVHEVYHNGPIDTFPAEILISQQDQKKTNQKQLLDEQFAFVGVAVEPIEDSINSHVVITLANKVIEQSTKPLDVQIVDVLNEFRRAPTRKAEFLRTIEDGSNEFKENLKKYADKLSPLGLPALEQSEFLNEVAKNIYEKVESGEYSNPADEKTLANIASNTIHNFQRIHVAILRNVHSTSEVINLILANPREKEAVLTNTRKVIAGKSMKFVGVYYHGHEEKDNILIIVAVDEYYPGSKKNYSVYFTEELTRLRTNPASYEHDLSVFRKEIKLKTYKQPLIKEIKELSKNLKFMKPVSPIENHQSLNFVARDYFFHMNNNKLSNEEDEYLLDRLSLEIAGFSKAKLFVNHTVFRPENFITHLLISEDDSQKVSRNALLNDEFKYFGCFNTLRGDDRISVLVLVDKVEEREPKSIEDEIFERISVFRRNPRTMVKYITEYQKELKDTMKSEEGNYQRVERLKTKLSFSEQLKDKLRSIKIKPHLDHCSDLQKALKSRLSSEDSLTVLSQSELREYLKKFVNNTFYCGMFAYSLEVKMFDGDATRDYSGEMLKGRGTFKSGNFLAKLLIEEANFETLNKIFAFAHRYLEIVTDLENDVVVGIFVDHAVEKTTIEIPLDIRQRVVRPLFTKDEVEQIRSDFNRLDIQNNNFIKPNAVLVFMQNSQRFINNNPIYYHAFKLLNTVENNENGINVNMLIDAVGEIIRKYKKFNWENVFNLLMTDNTKRRFDKKMFWETLQNLGYKLHESEANDMFDRVTIEKEFITREDFAKMMLMSEKGVFHYKNEEELDA